VSARITILDAVDDANLFAPWFREQATWAAWRAFLAALFALKMSSEQLAIYQHCTGRSAPPTQPATEAWLVCGRRGGKSFILALCAVFLTCFFDYRRYLAPGERGTVLIIATNSKQAHVIFRYVRALLTHIPMLAKLLERETADAFDLSNGTTIEVAAPSSAGAAIVEPPKRQRAKLTNNPLSVRASRNTALGRHVADLYRGYVAALGNPGDTVMLSNVLTACELKAATEVTRAKLLAGAEVDLVLVVKLEGLASRAERKLGVRPVSVTRVPSLAEHLAAKHSQKAALP
jgi:hypothetical protein